VYTAQTGALAALEMLVHLERSELLSTYALIRCSFDAALVIPIDRGLLPANWRTSPAPAELRSLGDEWIRDRVSVVLEVPSVVLESESNYLLNPAHPDFAGIEIDAPFPFDFDLRLLKK
jgi:RES domain-containing protein